MTIILLGDGVCRWDTDSGLIIHVATLPACQTFSFCSRGSQMDLVCCFSIIPPPLRLVVSADIRHKHTSAPPFTAQPTNPQYQTLLLFQKKAVITSPSTDPPPSIPRRKPPQNTSVVSAVDQSRTKKVRIAEHTCLRHVLDGLSIRYLAVFHSQGIIALRSTDLNNAAGVRHKTSATSGTCSASMISGKITPCNWGGGERLQRREINQGLHGEGEICSVR